MHLFVDPNLSSSLDLMYFCLLKTAQGKDIENSFKSDLPISQRPRFLSPPIPLALLLRLREHLRSAKMRICFLEIDFVLYYHDVKDT